MPTAAARRKLVTSPDCFQVVDDPACAANQSSAFIRKACGQVSVTAVLNGSSGSYTRFELLPVDAAIANDGCSNPLTRTGVSELTNAVTVKLIPSAMKPAFRP